MARGGAPLLFPRKRGDSLSRFWRPRHKVPPPPVSRFRHRWHEEGQSPLSRFRRQWHEEGQPPPLSGFRRRCYEDYSPLFVFDGDGQPSHSRFDANGTRRGNPLPFVFDGDMSTPVGGSNHCLQPNDIPPRRDRNLSNDIIYPSNSRYTLQWINPGQLNTRSL